MYVKSMNRNTAGLVIRSMSNPNNLRSFARATKKLNWDPRIRENAARRVVGIRVSQLYRRRKAAMLNWARRFHRDELQRLINLPPNNQSYNRLINSIPNPPITRNQLIKAIIARYLLNLLVHWPNAVNATRRFHNMYGRPVQNRIPNAQLVDFVMGLESHELINLSFNFPFYV